jgi:hypothetical protein
MVTDLYLFGCSHVSKFTGLDTIIPVKKLLDYESDRFKYHLCLLGGSLTYNFFWHNDYYGQVLRMLEGKNKANAAVSLILGEIDCRVHIGKQIQKGRPVDEAVEEVVDRLLLPLLDLKQKGWKCLVFAVQPASDHPACTLNDCPATGSPQFRNEVTREFNRILARKCRIHAFLFCDVFDEFMRDEKNVDMKYFMDYVHLRGSVVRSMYEAKLTTLLSE